MNQKEMITARIKMLGGSIKSGDILDYIIGKSEREVKDFCHVEELPEEASIYLIEWTVANYMTETAGYSKEWEKVREQAEVGLIKYRKMRW
ncbi:MAG: hypothetical protein Q4A29_03855 [Eubacteriales bacterium]|nr:hypothetical protein [Eubacteriales bacterium]